jgi:hypothetical protein
VEVHHQSQRDVQELHVAQKLGFVDRMHFLDGFDFDQEAVLDEQVESQFFDEHEAFVINLDLVLLLDGEAAQFQLATQSFFVDAFQQAWTEDAVDFDAGADHLAAEFLSLGVL